MLSTKKKVISIRMLIISSIILIAIAVSLWIFLFNRDKQQDKTYSGAKLVEQKEYCIFDWRIL